MSDYSKILNEITARLSGAAPEPPRNSAPVSRDGPEALAVKRELARTTLKTAPKSSVRAWRRAFRDATEKFDAQIEAAQKLSEFGRSDDALETLSNLAASVDGLFDADAKTVYRRFRNPLEEAVCDRFFPTTKERRRPPINYPRLYFELGSALFKRRRTREAINAFNKGLAFNPVDVETLLKLSEAQNRDRDFRGRLRTTTDALRYSLKPRDLARCYRDLGEFYVDSERYEFASYLFFFSLTLDEATETRRQLRILETRTRRPPKSPPFDKLRKAFEKEEIQLGPNEETVRALRELAENARDAGNFELAKEAFDALFRLTNDAVFRKELDALTRCF